MNILFINHEYPPIGGGGAVACERIVKVLVAQGHNVCVLTSAFGQLPLREEREGYRIFRIPSHRKRLFCGRIIEVIWFLVKGILSIGKIADEYKPDKIFSFFTLPAGAVAMYYYKVSAVPYWVFLRGIDVPGFKGGRGSILNRISIPLIRSIWKRAEKVVSNSRWLKELASQTSSGMPMEILPNVVDTDQFTIFRKDQHDTLNTLYVGRLNCQKGLNFLVDSLPEIERKIGGIVHFDIVGDGPERVALERKVGNYHLEDKVTFCGWLPHPRVIHKYRQADIFVFLSIDEGMPNSLLEACSSGLAVIASDIPAHREIISDQEGGFLVQLNDADALINAFLALRNISVREAMGAANRKRMEKDFSLKALWKRTAELV